MKKLLLSIVLAIGMLFAINVETQAQSAVGIQGGYDWLEGNVALAAQSGHWGATVGPFFTKMPGSGESVTGFCWSINWNAGLYYESGLYTSIGMNSAGYRSEISYNGGAYTDGVVEPMWIWMLGYRYGSDNLYLKGGAGYGWNEHAGSVAYGISVGWMFGN